MVQATRAVISYRRVVISQLVHKRFSPSPSSLPQHTDTDIYTDTHTYVYIDTHTYIHTHIYTEISRGDRDIGVAFQSHPVGHASSRVEAKDSTILSSRDM